jgi:16S rRNA (cytidine1402-2'-O)-methyltransferase
LFESIRHERRTVVLYESPHRLLETLGILAEELPDRRVCLARELTKLHEEFLRGTATQIATVLGKRGEVRGECVLVIEGASTQPEEPSVERASSLVALLLKEGVAKSVIQRALMLGLGMKRNEAYEAAHRAGESPP